MNRRLVLLLCVMIVLPAMATGALGTETIRGQVTCDGTPIPNAVVGIKSAHKATADAPPDWYALTDADGNYGPITVSQAMLYVAAWREGFTPTADAEVSIGEGEAKVANLELDKTAGKNIAEGITAYLASSEEWENPANNALDGEVSTMWSTPLYRTEPDYLILDLNPLGMTNVEINGVTIWWGDAIATAYRIDIITGANPMNLDAWEDPEAYGATVTTVYETAETAGGYQIATATRVNPIRLDVVSARGIRLYMTSYDLPPCYKIREFQVHSATDYTGLCLGYVKNPNENPLYDAAVQLGGPGGNAIITNTTGFYILSRDPGDYELYGDAPGYSPSYIPITLPTGGVPVTHDIILQSATEQGIYNGDCEIAGGDPSMLDGWELFIDDGGANPDMYNAGRDTNDNTTPGGAACTFIETDQRNLSSPYWSYGLLRPTAEHHITVDHTKNYNFYFKAKIADGSAPGFWKLVWYREDGSVIDDVACPNGSFIPADSNWTQYLHGDYDGGVKPMLRMKPPRDAAFIGIQLGITDLPDEAARYAVFHWDDIVVDSVTPPVVTGTVLDPFANPMPGAIVGLKTIPKATADAPVYAVTDADGNYTLTGQINTEYYIAAWKEGWTPTDDSEFVLAEDGMTGPTLQLTKTAGMNILPNNSLVDADEWDGGSTPDKAIDHDLNTFWVTEWDTFDPQHFYIDLLDQTDISGITIYRYYEMNDEGDSRDDFQIDVMTDGDPLVPSSWDEPSSGVQTVYSAMNTIHGFEIAPSLAVDPLYLPLSGINGIRVTFTNYHTPPTYDLREIQVHSASEYSTLVYGTVKDSSGEPIEGALAHIGPAVRNPALAGQMYTDAYGAYSFSDWKTGTENLTADGIGYANSDAIIHLTSDGNPVLYDFVLPDKSETSLAPNWNFEEADPGNPDMPRFWEEIEDGDPEFWLSQWSYSTDYNNTPGGEASGLVDQLDWTGEGRWSGWLSALIPVNPDGTVGYNIWLHRMELEGDGWYHDHFIQWYAANGSTYLGTEWYDWYNPPVDYNVWWRTPAQWATYRIVPPTDAAYMRVGFGCYSWDGGLGFYDDVIVEPVSLTSPESNRIGDVKSMENGSYINLIGKHLTAINDGGGVPVDTGYIEEADRAGGIRIDTSDLGGVFVGAGDTVNITGIVGVTAEGEKYIALTQMDWVADTRPVDALGMNVRFANTAIAQGLYAKLAGNVTEVGDDNFTIADGSAATAGAPVTMKVYCGGLTKPAVDDTVRVRGVVSTNGTNAVLYMRNEQVDLADATSPTQPLPFAGPVKALRDYLLLGTFGNPGDSMAVQLATDYISEATVRPSLGETIGGKTWFRHDGYDELVDLNRLFPGNTPTCTEYAHIYIWSPIAQNVDIPIGSDDSIKIFVNGTQVYEHNVTRSLGYGQDNIANVPLAAGLNSVLIKIVHTGTGFGFVTQFAQPGTYTGPGWGNSAPMPGLGYLLNKQP